MRSLRVFVTTLRLPKPKMITLRILGFLMTSAKMGRKKKSYIPTDAKYIQLPPIQVASYWMRTSELTTIGGFLLSNNRRVRVIPSLVTEQPIDENH